MAQGMGAGALLIVGIFLVLGGMMWDAGPGQAWQDMNNSITNNNSTQSAAVKIGQVESYGFGMLLAALGVVFMIGSVLLIVFDATKKLGGR